MKRKIVIVLLIALICSLVFCTGVVAFAETATVEYSDVLDDLRKDSEFDVNAYPEKANDYSLEVIGVSESVNDELFVYVYQPSGKAADIRATSINISKGYKTLDWFNYTLTFCNSYETLYKYKVDDFVIDDIRLRYYDITSIFRAWNKNYGDSETGNDNVITEVSYKVATIYKLGVENNEIVVDSIPTDTIQVVSKYVGFVRYAGGFLWQKNACDSHFVAFSTDIPIEKLREADVYYRKQHYSYDGSTIIKPEKFGSIETKYSYVRDTQNFQYESSGFWNVGTICRDLIQTVNDFVASENFTNVYSHGLFNSKTQSKISEEGINNLKDCEWVIRFAQTDYYYSSQSSPPYITQKGWDIVSDVSLLRLEGISNGHTFNLGVVDNKQSGGNDPINDTIHTVESDDELFELIFKIILIILGIVLAIVIFWFTWPLWKVLFKGLWWLITAPFKAIAKAAKNGKQKSRKKK